MSRSAKVIDVFEDKFIKHFTLEGECYVEEGQEFRCKDSAWKVIKRRWLRPPHINLVLGSVDGKWPIVGDILDLLLDNSPNEDEEPSSKVVKIMTFGTIDRTNVLWLSGSLHLEVNNVVTDGKNKWQVLSTCKEIPTSGEGNPVVITAIDQITHPNVNSKLTLVNENKC